MPFKFNPFTGKLDVVNSTTGFVAGGGTGVANHVATWLDANTIQSSPVIIDGSGNVSGLNITAGSVLFAGASGAISQDNSNFYFDDTNNRLGVGVGASTNTITVGAVAFSNILGAKGEGTTDLYEIASQRYSATAAFAAKLVGLRSKGSQASQTVVTTNDALLHLDAYGHDGTDYALSGRIAFEVDAAVAANRVPGRIKFQVAQVGTGTLSTKFYIDSLGDPYFTPTNSLSVSTNIVVGSLAGTFAVLGASTLDVSGADFFFTGTGQLVFNSTTGVTISTPSNNVTLAAASGVIDVQAPISMKNQGEIRLLELTVNGVNYLSMKAPATLAANYTLTWPADDGNADQALFTNGSGTLTWRSTPTVGGAGVDERIVRWDGTNALQSSLAALTDAGALSGLTLLDCDNLRLDGNVLSSTDTNGSITLTPNGTGSVVLIGVTLTTANAISGLTQLTCDNLRLDGNTLSSTSGALILDSNATGIQMSDPVEMALNTLKFGAANEAAISYDGTSLILNPRVSGSVAVNDVVIGSSSASGGNDSNLRVFRLGVLGSDISGTVGINCVISTAARTALNFIMTAPSGTVLAPLVVNLIDQSTATQMLSTSTFEYTLNSASHTLTNATSASLINFSNGINAAIAINVPTGTTQNHNFICIKLAPNSKGVGGAHSVTGTGVLNFYSTGIFQKKMNTFTVAAGITSTYVGAYFGDDLCMQNDAKIIFDNTETDSTASVIVTKGTTDISWISASSLLRTRVSGTNVWDLTTTSNGCLVDLTMSDAKNIVLNTTTGTKIGTATTQKLGFFNKTPVVQPAAYTPTNVTTDRSYDANATTLDEIADVLGTLIADLQSLGLVG